MQFSQQQHTNALSAQKQQYMPGTPMLLGNKPASFCEQHHDVYPSQTPNTLWSRQAAEHDKQVTNLVLFLQSLPFGLLLQLFLLHLSLMRLALSELLLNSVNLRLQRHCCVIPLAHLLLVRCCPSSMRTYLLLGLRSRCMAYRKKEYSACCKIATSDQRYVSAHEQYNTVINSTAGLHHSITHNISRRSMGDHRLAPLPANKSNADYWHSCRRLTADSSCASLASSLSTVSLIPVRSASSRCCLSRSLRAASSCSWSCCWAWFSCNS